MPCPAARDPRAVREFSQYFQPCTHLSDALHVWFLSHSPRRLWRKQSEGDIYLWHLPVWCGVWRRCWGRLVRRRFRFLRWYLRLVVIVFISYSFKKHIVGIFIFFWLPKAVSRKGCEVSGAHLWGGSGEQMSSRETEPSLVTCITLTRQKGKSYLLEHLYKTSVI